MTKQEIFDKLVGAMCADNVARYVDYNRERALAYYNKEIAKIPRPWCNHVHINEGFTFTNTVRRFDRQTVNLFDNIVYNDNLSLEDKLLNILYFRLVNRWDTIVERFGGPIGFSYLDDDKYRALHQANLYQYDNGGFKTPCQSNAYFLSTPRKMANQYYPELAYSDVAVVKLASEYLANMMAAYNAETMEEAYNHVLTIDGCGGFLAYQITADLSYMEETKFDDNSDDFCIAGPGTTKGSWFMLGENNPNVIIPGMSFEDFCIWWRDNIKEVAEHFGLDWNWEEWHSFNEPRFQVFTTQLVTNSFCEYSKLHKLDCNMSMRPRYRNYDGVNEMVGE